MTALNLFLVDVYTEQRCLHEGILPWELVLSRKEYKRELMGVKPARGVFTHVVGTDLIRDDDGRLPRARGQLPLPERRLLRAREPEPAEPLLPGALQRATRCGPSGGYPGDLRDTLALRGAGGGRGTDASSC